LEWHTTFMHLCCLILGTLLRALLLLIYGRWQAALREADAAQQAERVEQLRVEMSAAAGAAAQVSHPSPSQDFLCV
jgi:hypothetical protein